ncbi:MAG TPA: quinolinate synthase NadA, partial [Candidatus Methanomethylophilaceae archaeon]|nr:quinolinate synthase NadA [Candidatus Methanomethylophilaceae archaeon]
MNVTKRIQTLKADRDALILAHNYCSPQVQDVADFVGDSLALAIRATD